ncbi:MAG: hypothetical protein WBB29_21805 [Geitlerinemataceae cyanobacterium]
MTQPNLLELAQQGDPKAISALLNQQLQAQGIRSRVALKEGCLHVLLHAEHYVPDREAMIDFVRVNLLYIDADLIFRAIVYGRQTGEEKPDWTQMLVSTGEDFERVASSNLDPQLEPESLQSGDLSTSVSNSNPVAPWRVGIITAAVVLGLAVAYFLWHSHTHRQNSVPSRESRIDRTDTNPL